ncbi:MAG: thioredoxin [Myxococcales bacterium]
MAAGLAFRCASCGAFNRMALVVPGREAVCGRCKKTLDVAGHPTELSGHDFDGAVGSSPVPMLVDFWAPWCGPCRAMAPVLHELGRSLAGRVVVAKLNVDEAPELAGRLGIQGIPTMILFRGGREVERIVGARSLAELRRAVEAGSLAVASA